VLKIYSTKAQAPGKLRLVALPEHYWKFAGAYGKRIPAPVNFALVTWFNATESAELASLNYSRAGTCSWRLHILPYRLLFVLDNQIDFLGRFYPPVLHGIVP
jgi:hypothetical protein